MSTSKPPAKKSIARRQEDTGDHREEHTAAALDREAAIVDGLHQWSGAQVRIDDIEASLEREDLQPRQREELEARLQPLREAQDAARAKIAGA